MNNNFEPKIELENDLINEKINQSVSTNLKMAIVIMIISWASFGVALTLLFATIILMFVSLFLATVALIFAYFLIFVWLLSCLVASFMIGVQLIRKQRIAHGVCILLFGWLSLGIWPFIVAVLNRKDAQYDITSHKFKKSCLTMYNVSIILLIVGMATLILHIGILIIVVAGYFIGIQDIRRNKVTHGICIILFGWLSLGIWPLVYTLKQSKKLRVEITQIDNIKEHSDINVEIENIGVELENIDEEKILNSGYKQEATDVTETKNSEFKMNSAVDESTIKNEKLSINNRFKNMNNKNGLLIGLIIALVIIGFVILMLLSNITKTSSVTHIEHDPIEIYIEYELEWMQSTIPKIYESPFNTDQLDQVIVCGEDVPVGEYKLKTYSNTGDFHVYYQDVGEISATGEEILDQQWFICEEGKQLRYGNSYGSVDLISSTETEYANQIYEFDIVMTTTFTERGELDEITCTKDQKPIECSLLPTYDQLIEETVEVYESGNMQTEVTETMRKKWSTSTCVSSEMGIIECEDAVMYEELVEQLK